MRKRKQRTVTRNGKNLSSCKPIYVVSPPPSLSPLFLSLCVRVEYVDSLGRSRRCMKKDLSEMQRLDKEMESARNTKRDKSRCSTAHYYVLLLLLCFVVIIVFCCYYCVLLLLLCFVVIIVFCCYYCVLLLLLCFIVIIIFYCYSCVGLQLQSCSLLI